MKKKRSGTHRKSVQTGEGSGDDRVSVLSNAAKRIEIWFPWIVGGLYVLLMGYLTFRYHRIGGLGVETDFYVELVPQAKKLLAGEFSPLNYGAKGPVYSILLSLCYLFVRDYFTAGLLLNLAAGAVFLVTLYFLLRCVFNTATAVIATLAAAFNHVFLSFTYQAASDLPFMALCALSMLFLFRSGRKRDIAVSAVLGLSAFLTRYNGAFVAIGAVLFLALADEPVRIRGKRIGLWVGIFLVTGLPWFIPNWIATGNPVHNENYINIMLEFYGFGREGVSYENWTDALPKEFTGVGDIILYDPVYFARHMGRNVAVHFVDDMKLLMGWRLGIFVIAGIFLSLVAGMDRKKLLFIAFGLFYFLILTLVFYNVRFSLFLIAFYLPVAVWPLTSARIAGFLKRREWMPAAILMIIVMSYAVTSSRDVYSQITQTPPYLEDLRDLGRALDKYEPDKTKKIIGRKPHVAYFAGLEAHMFPADVKTVPELVGFCREYGIDYILYSGIEAGYRPDVRILLAVDKKHPGLERVYYNRFGVIYRIEKEQ